MSSFSDQPASSMSVNPNQAYQYGMGQRIQQQGDLLAQQYAQASQDPDFAIGTPQDRMLREQQLTDDVYNRLGASAMGGTGKSLAAQALVQYRLGLIQQQQAALQNLRSSMAQMYGVPTGPGQNVVFGQPRTPGMGTQFLGALAGGYGQALGQGGMSAGPGWGQVTNWWNQYTNPAGYQSMNPEFTSAYGGGWGGM